MEAHAHGDLGDRLRGVEEDTSRFATGSRGHGRGLRRSPVSEAAETKAEVRRGEREEPTDDSVAGDSSDVEDPPLRSVARGGFRFEPLPESRQEVQEIAALYAPKSAAYLGSDATEEKAKSIGKDVPLIHYACHAVVNERFPLDSALVFTIPDKPRRVRTTACCRPGRSSRRSGSTPIS